MIKKEDTKKASEEAIQEFLNQFGELDEHSKLVLEIIFEMILKGDMEENE